jgi:hypothetical protein
MYNVTVSVFRALQRKQTLHFNGYGNDPLVSSVENDRQVPRKPRLVGGVKGHNQNEISSPRSPALWAGNFTSAVLKFLIT